MILASLMQQIQSKELHPYYFFECEDRTVADIYLSNMEKSAGLRRIVVENTIGALKANSAGSLVKTQRKLYIIRDDKEIVSNEKMWARIKEQSNSVFVFIFNSIDRRTNFYKQFEQDIVSFPKITAPTLFKHLRGQTSIDDNQLKELIVLTDRYYGYALSELNKISNYAQSEKMEESQAYAILRAHNMLGREPNDNLFRAIDAVLCGDRTKAYAFLKDEEPVSTLAAFYSSIRNLWLVRSISNPNSLKAFGLNDMLINMNRGKRTIYNSDQLQNLMLLCIDIEQKMKRGVVPMESAIDYLLAKIFSGGVI